MLFLAIRITIKVSSITDWKALVQGLSTEAEVFTADGVDVTAAGRAENAWAKCKLFEDVFK